MRQQQFGGSLGGPIKTNKTFFFADYEGSSDARRSRRHHGSHIEDAEWRFLPALADHLRPDEDAADAVPGQHHSGRPDQSDRKDVRADVPAADGSGPCHPSLLPDKSTSTGKHRVPTEKIDMPIRRS